MSSAHFLCAALRVEEDQSLLFLIDRIERYVQHISLRAPAGRLVWTWVRKRNVLYKLYGK